ncbi:hypothetical protein PIIN_02139 [Serendipita indica DSM 11827]|uniref:Uncharacterized protein n=1 Tax=Serendipita indica (strain DSM 11827) TaxID=1109443 RepID=G4TAC4_SERID|nr:hypothetical protein PIIN_02139 [Serendipita indica DSM 11827]
MLVISTVRFGPILDTAGIMIVPRSLRESRRRIAVSRQIELPCLRDGFRSSCRGSRKMHTKTSPLTYKCFIVFPVPTHHGSR